MANNVSAHWIKEIGVKRYEDDFQTLPTNNPTDVNRYSDSILKHMSKDSLKTFENTLLCSKKKKKLRYLRTKIDAHTTT